MSRLPIFKPRELIRILQKADFEIVRKSRGSHCQLAHSDGRRTTVPVHKSRDIGPGLLRKILRDVEMNVDDLENLR